MWDYQCRKTLVSLKIPRPVEVWKCLLPIGWLSCGQSYHIFNFHIIPYKYFLQQLPDKIYRISSKTQISKLKKKSCNIKILMLQLSSGDLFWIENQYVMVNMYLKKEKKKTNINPITSVYCGLWKTILYVVKSAKIHEFWGFTPPAQPPTRALPWTNWGPSAAPDPSPKFLRTLQRGPAMPLMSV